MRVRLRNWTEEEFLLQLQCVHRMRLNDIDIENSKNPARSLFNSYNRIEKNVDEKTLENFVNRFVCLVTSLER